MNTVLPPAIDLDRIGFDPAAGVVIREPEGSGYGYWAGGHKVFFDDQTSQFVLFYRLRSPLEAGRGGRCALAVSDDGVRFRDVWSATKAQFAANSIEVGHCVRDARTAEWRLYVSYELAGGPWRVDLIRGSSLEQLDTQSRRTVIQPFDYGFRSLKDPVVYQRDGRYRMYVAGPARTRPRVEGDVHHAGGYEATLLAESEDGLYFPALRYAFEVTNEDTWDGRRARINSVVECSGGHLAFYDGGRTSYDMYEEQCGVAWSPDGLRFEREPLAAPWVRSPHGCVRYVFAMRHADSLYYYYEYTREDLSHDLRVAVVPVPPGF